MCYETSPITRYYQEKDINLNCMVTESDTNTIVVINKRLLDQSLHENAQLEDIKHGDNLNI